MSMRDIVTGSDICSAGDGAGPSNAVGTLVNSLIGGAGKVQEQLKELPTVQGIHGPHQGMHSMDQAAMAAHQGSALQIPGVGPSQMVSNLMQSMHINPPRTTRSAPTRA
eukprot:gene19848-26543_t